MIERRVNFREKLYLIAHSCVTLGTIETLKALGRYILRESVYDNFDKIHSTDTTTPISKIDLEILDLERRRCTIGYLTAPERFIRRLISQLDIDYQEYDFVDIGCGKGRGLLVASNYPFRSISGIDASRPVLAIAKHNLQIFKCAEQRCFNIQIHNQDARNYEPHVANTVFYFFEPFDNFILGEVLARISSRLKGQGKQIYVICIWLDLESVLPLIEKLGFHKIRHQKMMLGEFNYTIFSMR